MSLILGLWSIVLEPGKTFSQQTTPGIQITNVAFGPEIKGDARSVVTIKYPEFEQDEDDEDESEEEDEDDDSEGDIKLPKLITKEAVLAILKPNVTEQVSINVSLVEDVEMVEFSVTGQNPVHLIGHYIRQEDFDQDPYSDSDSEYDSNDEDIPSDFDEEDSDIEGMSGLIAEGSDDEMEDPARFQELRDEIEKSDAKASKKRAAADEAAAPAAADESMSSTLSKNQKKKLAKKQKLESGEAAPVAAAAPAAASPAVKKEAPAPVEKKEEKAKPAVRTLQGGLQVIDAKIGDGPVAKSGMKVGMRYIGKLDNGKIFDQNTKGAPLKFTLGRGEVIKGWDVGVAGMKTGGERKLIIPAALAYGKKGTGPIPGNATLTFDVKLVSVGK